MDEAGGMTKFIDSGAAKLRIEEAATKKQARPVLCVLSVHRCRTNSCLESLEIYYGNLTRAFAREVIMSADGTNKVGARRRRRDPHIHMVDETQPCIRNRLSLLVWSFAQARIDSGQERIVGVNCHRLDEECELPL